MYSAFQLAKKFIRYYLTAANSKGHGVHSPFVFDFIKYVKNDNNLYGIYSVIEQVRERLLADKSLIDVQDFGAGSTVLKTKQRVVGQMAQSSLKPKRFAQLLFRIVQYYKPATIVELGTSFGITTAYMASAAPGAKVYTLEGAPAIARIARQNFIDLRLDNIQLVEGNFTNTLLQLLSNVKKIDLAFVDGNHRKLPTLDYFHKLLEVSTPESIFIFDDIHWSKEMEEAWEHIKQHKEVTLSIDLFFIGLVFFRKEQKVPQHFCIRF